ncbi:hypothetical protein BaRGS_00037351 [Batillaria attramentaria]|uniref:C3H1-type domain-containing protein n=1 Tax=Batillaria attramentaria TaxID=370345 RepID=A0ABD0J9E4_9CAEN
MSEEHGGGPQVDFGKPEADMQVEYIITDRDREAIMSVFVSGGMSSTTQRLVLFMKWDGDGASSETTDEEAEEARRKAIEEENARQNALWAERDRLGHELWQQKIREEWEERERREKEERERKEQEESEKREKQENLLKAATANENKTWHNPLAPAHYTGNTGSQQEIIRDINRCPFFAKTGACRFGDRCSRVHVRPESSTILLIPGMFESFELRKSATDDYDTGQE